MIKTAILLATERMSILREQDVVPFRNRVKECAAGIKMGLVNQTYLITASSELARNMLTYADGGIVLIETIEHNGKKGIRLMFEDQGPGIADVVLALKDGFSTGRSLGVGLPGAKRLVNEFEIASEPGKGTSITIIRWANG